VNLPITVESENSITRRRARVLTHRLKVPQRNKPFVEAENVAMRSSRRVRVGIE